MTIGAVLMTDMVDRFTMVSSPQDCAAVVCPVQGCCGTPPTKGGVPARYMVEALIRATLPAAGLAHGFCRFPLGTQAGTEATRRLVVKLNCCTLACVPPHSAPQLTT